MKVYVVTATYTYEGRTDVLGLAADIEKAKEIADGFIASNARIGDWVDTDFVDGDPERQVSYQYKPEQDAVHQIILMEVQSS